MDDQHIALGAARHVRRHRSEQSAGDRVETDVADHENIRSDLIDQSEQGIDRRTLDGTFLDGSRTGRGGAVSATASRWLVTSSAW